MKKSLAIIMAICFVFMAIPASSFAASYEECDHPMFGWGVSVSAAYNKAIGSKICLGGLDNRQSNVAATYTYTRTFSHSITCTSSLSSELNGSINFESGAVNGGLGAKINSSFSIQSSYTHSYSETYSVSVPARKNLTLYSQAYGVELTVYAIGHTAWVHGTKVNGIIGIPQYQKFVPKLNS